jgi:glycosyltransferase involved in cell wall biosynthesis
MENPLVSITITTKNEEKNIQNCLESIKAQTYQNIEIIVVDNNSTDKTKEIAKKYTNNVFDKGPERSAQRNLGMINKSKGTYVMFVDADMIFSPTLIEECVNLMEKNDFTALHIPEIVLGSKFYSQVRRFERTFYNGTVIDGARFFNRNAFTKVGGFDETMSGPEDWDIDKKIKQVGKIGLLLNGNKYKNWNLEKLILEKGVNPKNYGAVIYHNEAEFDLKKYISKKGYYSTSFDTYIKKWGTSDSDIKKQLGFSYRFVGVFVENGKWLKLLTHPFLTFGMYYLRFLVGIKFLTRRKG